MAEYSHAFCPDCGAQDLEKIDRCPNCNSWVSWVYLPKRPRQVSIPEQLA